MRYQRTYTVLIVRVKNSHDVKCTRHTKIRCSMKLKHSRDAGDRRGRSIDKQCVCVCFFFVFLLFYVVFYQETSLIFSCFY